MLHRGIVAPEIAKLVEFDKRIAALTEALKTLKTDAEITEWHVRAAALLRDLEKAGLSERGDALAKAMEAGGWRGGPLAWNWTTGADAYRVAPIDYRVALQGIALALQEKVQDLILKDLVSGHDDATPPEFKELVERYYELLSGGTSGKN